MREMFQYADKNKDETLSLKEVISLLKYLNIEVDHDQARQVFEVGLNAKICQFFFSNQVIAGNYTNPSQYFIADILCQVEVITIRELSQYKDVVLPV